MNTTPLKKEKKYQRGIRLIVGALLVLVLNITALGAPFTFAVATPVVPPVDVNSSGFKLSVCDGPDLSGLASGTKIFLNGQNVTLTHGQNPPGYIPCNFNGVMLQIRHLIDVMIVLGVLAAMLGFCYIGYLYIAGGKGNIDQAKVMFPKLVWGFIIMLVAWFIVFQLITWLTGSSGFSTLLGS